MMNQKQRLFNQNQRSDTLDDQRRYKLIIVGDSAAGKTTLTKWIRDKTFTSGTRSTIYLDLAPISLEYHGEKLEIMFWDTAGQEQYNSMVATYFKEAKCNILVVDCSPSKLQEKSWKEQAESWKDLLEKEQANHSEIPTILVFSKFDLLKKAVEAEEMDPLNKEEINKFCSKRGISNHFFVSVTKIETLNVKELEDFICETLLNNAQPEEENETGDTVILGDIPDDQLTTSPGFGCGRCNS